MLAKAYYMSNKSWPILCSNLLYKMGQDFLNLQYSYLIFFTFFLCYIRPISNPNVLPGSMGSLKLANVYKTQYTCTFIGRAVHPEECGEGSGSILHLWRQESYQYSAADRNRIHTVCPGSSDPFHICNSLYKMGHYFLDI